MLTAANVLIVLIAIAHLGFLVLEMFFWDHPVGRKVFAMTAEQSASSRVLAANQGLYNGFLAAGLLWAWWLGAPEIRYFFLGCVLLAGLFGGFTAKRSILITQALPAAVAIALLLAA